MRYDDICIVNAMKMKEDDYGPLRNILEFPSNFIYAGKLCLLTGVPPRQTWRSANGLGRVLVDEGNGGMSLSMTSG